MDFGLSEGAGEGEGLQQCFHYQWKLEELLVFV